MYADWKAAWKMLSGNMFLDRIDEESFCEMRKNTN